MKHYYRNAIILWIVLIVISITTLFNFTDWHWLLVLLLSSNISTFITMGFDKLQASSRGSRIPEVMFYLMTFFGGSIGMLAGMYTFRHKTRKVSFQFFVYLMILIQIALIFWLGDVELNKFTF